MAADPIQVRLARLEGVYEQIDRRLGAIEVRLDTGLGQVSQRLDARFDILLARMDDRFGTLDRKIDATAWRLVVLILANWITLMLAIVGSRLLHL